MPIGTIAKLCRRSLLRGIKETILTLDLGGFWILYQCQYSSPLNASGQGPVSRHDSNSDLGTVFPLHCKYET